MAAAKVSQSMYGWPQTSSQGSNENLPFPAAAGRGAGRSRRIRARFLSGINLILSLLSVKKLSQIRRHGRSCLFLEFHLSRIFYEPVDFWLFLFALRAFLPNRFALALNFDLARFPRRLPLLNLDLFSRRRKPDTSP